MKPFARINLSSAALRRGVLVSSLALAAGTLWWVTHDCEAQDELIGPLHKKTPPPEWNAYIAYVAATNAVREWPEVGETRPSQERKAALVAANAEALALMREASTRSVWCDTAFREDCLNGFFSPGDFARMLHMMRWDLEAQIALGYRTEALDSIRAMASFAATMRGGAESVVCWELANSLAGNAIWGIMEFANAPCATDDDLAVLAEFLRSLPDVQSQRHSFCMAARRETFWWGEFAFRQIEESVQGHSILARYVYQPNRTRRLYHDLVRRVCDMVERGYDKEAWQGLMAEVESMDSGINRWLPNNKGRELLSAICPAWDVLAKDEARSEFYSAAAEVVVAAERYRRKNGVRPESLSALVPEFMPRVPDDPFGANAALNYDAARGIVWTVGENGDFNGEKQPGTDSYGRNFRYVINLDGTPTYQPKRSNP
ncbi:MAG: hypothetical protein II823_03390 [Kiritimatiellae bacterium]|nr:hypothetical protein [Kiritimatiellia bacterium]